MKRQYKPGKEMTTQSVYRATRKQLLRLAGYYGVTVPDYVKQLASEKVKELEQG